MGKRSARRNWIYNRRVLPILAELSKHPLTPEVLRQRTGMPRNSYVNEILAELAARGLVKCLNPDQTIGKVYCINPENKETVLKILRRAGIVQEIQPPPELSWTGYGRLLCSTCRQMRIVFLEASELKHEGKMITMPGLRRRIAGIKTGDFFRALSKLIKLKLMKRLNTDPFTYEFTNDGKAILEFLAKERFAFPAE